MQQNEVDILVEVARDSDGKCVSYRQGFAFDLHWGDLLVGDAGLFQARAAVMFGNRVVARGETDWHSVDVK
jgi:hypothetical protein